MLTAVTAIGLLGGVVAAGPASAVTSTYGPHAPKYTISCSNDGTKYSIAQDNVNIRATPDGAIKAPINKTATFLSRSSNNGDLGVTCTSSSVDGTVWIYGEGQANHVLGWVGLNYMHVLAHGSQY